MLERPHCIPNSCDHAFICVSLDLKLSLLDLHFFYLVVVEEPNAFGCLLYANDLLQVLFEIRIFLNDFGKRLVAVSLNLLGPMIGKFVFLNIMINCPLLRKSGMAQNWV